MAALRDDPAVLSRVAAALQLIAAHSPDDLRRIQSLMRGIVIGPLFGARAEWRQSLASCILSTRYLRRDRPSPLAVAGTIIHELAHARLDALGIETNEDRCARVERVCFRATERFLRRLPASQDQVAALADVEEYLAFETGVWRAVLRRDFRPWYLRAVVRLIQGFRAVSRRAAPT